MYIKKLIERGVAVCTFLCMMAAVPAFAGNICYLPSGQCGADAVKIKARYTMSTGEKLPDNGKCGVYNTQNTDSWQTPPNEMYKGEVGETANCVHSCGKEAPENCIATCKTTNNICYACDTELKYGRYAWYCKASCSSGGLVTEEEKLEMQAEGCYKFTFSNYEGNRCYEYLNLKESYSTIITNAERKAEYDDSCFTFEEKKVEGGVCYIPTPKTCKAGYYMAVVSAEGVVPEKCECKEYLLDFKLRKRESKSFSSNVDLEFGPKAETKYVTIVSTLTGDQGVIDVAYSIKDSTCENIGCHTTASADGKELTIACEANLTAVEKVCNITAVQNNADIDAANKPIGDLTIGVKVKPDTCGDYSITDNCVGDTKAKVVEDVVSETGQACYQCLNDKCPEGTTSEVPTSRDGYNVSKTDYGTECFAPKPCDEGYSTDFQGVADCGDKKHPDGWSYDFLGYSGDLRCGKCIPATCNGDGYELKCIPEPEIPCADKNSDDCPWTCVGPIAAGDDVLFNCNPKACTDGDTNIKTVNDCTKIGHPEGWKIEEVAKSGTEVCNKCQPKKCTGKKADGSDYDHKCEPQPRCLNPNDESCGYTNITIEYEGDTPKYDSDDKVCPKGSKDIKSTANCTKNGHPEGWDIQTVGKSGEEPCNECIKKTCTGMGRDVRCTDGDKPLCDEKDAMCGYKDFVVEYEGDDPKISYNIKKCPEGTNDAPLMGCGKNRVVATAGTKLCYIFERPDTTCPENYIYDGVRTCGCVCNLKVEAPWSVDERSCTKVCLLAVRQGYTLDREKCEAVPVDCKDGYSTAITSCPGNFRLETNGKSGDGVCGKCICDLKATGNWTVDTEACTLKCNLPQKVGYDIDTTKCEYVVKNCPDGFSTAVTSASCPSPRYKFSTNGQSGELTCGKCECALQPHGNWGVNTTTCTEYCKLGEKTGYKIENCEYVPLTCESGYSTSVTSCSGNYKLVTKGQSGDSVCGKCECGLQPKDGYKIENCEYVPLGPTQCQRTGGALTKESKGYKGQFGDGCCEDIDCGTGDEFPLYCINAPSTDGKSTKSCRECGTFNDCKNTFAKNLTRLHNKCRDKDDCGIIGSVPSARTYTSGYNHLTVVQYDGEGKVVFNQSNGWVAADWYGYDDRLACRYGECVTYDDSYTYTGSNTNKLALAKNVKEHGGKGSDDASKCSAGSKSYPSGCSADKAVVVGETPFGSFCWACKK